MGNVYKTFTTAGACFSDENYMVNNSGLIANAAALIRAGKYFCINRGRQYGKTTTFSMLSYSLQEEYDVFYISLEAAGQEDMKDLSAVASFVFSSLYEYAINGSSISMEEAEFLKAKADHAFSGKISISTAISEFMDVAKRPVVLFIDEVDQASNYDGFLLFLGLMRDKYLQRKWSRTFHSVVLASVYDVKNLKLRVRPEEQHMYNSPWNIAADFDYDMSLSEAGIREMLLEYSADRQINMDTEFMAGILREYTSGYPYLVSRLCQIMDEKKLSWDKAGFLQAVKSLLVERNTLFDDMAKKLNDFDDLRNMLFNILYLGRRYAYNAYDRSMNLAVMFGYVENEAGIVVVANRIFEIWLYNLFSSEESHREPIYTEGSIDKNQFIHDDILDMEKVLERFTVHFNDIYSGKDEKFIENMGRKLFLLYLRPIINGTGNYYVEAQTRDETRTDVVVDYLGIQYVVELKIWRGESYNQQGEQQLSDYLDYFHIDTGYLVSFCFNKKKKPGVVRHRMNGKLLIEAIV